MEEQVLQVTAIRKDTSPHGEVFVILMGFQKEECYEQIYGTGHHRGEKGH